MKRKVLFLGFADTKIDLGKYYLEDYAVWTMNDYYKWFPDLMPDAVFEIHKEGQIELAQAKGRFPGDYKAIYNKSGADIITRFSHGLDNEFNVGIEALIELFGEKFLVGTFSFMFAWAIQQRYSSIAIEGIHLKAHSEYATQIHGMLRNIDRARRNGITVNIPGDWENTWRTLASQVKEEWRGIYG